MKPSDIPWSKTDTGRKAHYTSFSGWPVFPDGVLPGATIEPPLVEPDPSVRLVRPHVTYDRLGDDFVVQSCEYCNFPANVEERGVVPADYELYILHRESEGPVTHTCHSCIEEATVVEYDVESFDPENVFNIRE